MRKNEHNIASEQEIKQWVIDVGQGDQIAFTSLLRSFWNKVYTQALTYLKSSEEAQEITQDVFIKIWENREKLADVENFSNYLFILSRNYVISQLRKKRENTLSLSIEVEELLMRPDSQLQYKESYKKILQLIDQLPPTRKKVFTLSRLEGKSYEEIGEVLNISRNGVKDHIVKALNYLRTKFLVNEERLLILCIVSKMIVQ